MEGLKKEVVDKYEKQLLSLTIKNLDLNFNDVKIHDSICHTWYIVKDKGVEINWKKPLLQKSQIYSKIKIAASPFAEGAMRYAFLANDMEL